MWASEYFWCCINKMNDCHWMHLQVLTWQSSYVLSNAFSYILSYYSSFKELRVLARLQFSTVREARRRRRSLSASSIELILHPPGALVHFEPFFYVPLPRGATPSTTTIKVHQGFPWPSLRPGFWAGRESNEITFHASFPYRQKIVMAWWKGAHDIGPPEIEKLG